MTTSKKSKRRSKMSQVIRNPVAKFMNKVNKPNVEADKKKYSRKKKHKRDCE